MLFRTKYIVAEGQKGLLYKNKKFEKVLDTGVYRFWHLRDQYELKLVDVEGDAREVQQTSVLTLIEKYPSAFDGLANLWQTGSEEIGLVYENNVLQDIKQAGQKGAYWKGVGVLRLDKVSLTDGDALSERQAALMLGSANANLRKAALAAVHWATVSDGYIGFLEVDRKFVQLLEPGYYAWWQFGRELKVKLVDCKLQNMEVNGQEILTKDKVSLRINLSATWQVSDAKLVYETLSDHSDYLYREMQLALRSVVSTQTLDQLLVDKNLLNKQVQAIVAEKAIQYGLTVKTVGARDIVLPGEMKTILAQVVEAEKMAEANLIRRREETQATRSLHNTAKVMEGNPVLLRLKELETLEKITNRINTLNVYGGLDGVMNDMVKLTEK